MKCTQQLAVQPSLPGPHFVSSNLQTLCFSVHVFIICLGTLICILLHSLPDPKVLSPKLFFVTALSRKGLLLNNQKIHGCIFLIWRFYLDPWCSVEDFCVLLVDILE